MKKLLSTVLIVAGAFVLKAQQIPLTSQYMFNGLMLNPAVAGSKADKFVVRLQSRNQWVGVEGAPVTQVASMHAMIHALNVGIGGYVFNDVVGPTRQTGFQTAYAYHIAITPQSRLSLGLQLGMFQYHINLAKLSFDEGGDIVQTRGTESRIVPDASFGALFYNSVWFAGISVPHLLGGRVKDLDFKLDRHYQLMAGVTTRLSDDVRLEPSMLFRFVNPVQMSIDINARFIFKNTFWVGGSYRTEDAMVFMAGMRVSEKVHFGYSYDLTTSNLKAFSRGTHEIMLGFDLNHENKKQKTVIDTSPSFL